MSDPCTEFRFAQVPMARLEALCARGSARALETGAPVLVSLMQRLADAEPLAALERLGAAGGYRFYWERPSEAVALAAGGAALAVEGQGPQRFGQVQRALADAWARAVSEPVMLLANACASSAERVEQVARGGANDTPPGPCAVGGFSFFDVLAEAQWPGFRPGQMVVPAWSVRRDAGRDSATLTILVQPEEPPAAAAQRLRVLGAALDEALAAPSPAPPGPPPQEELDVPSNRVRLVSDPQTDRRAWVAAVSQALQAIHSGTLSKVVLARALELECERAPSPYAALRNLRRDFPTCYTFMVDPGAGQLFLGATPEQLACFRPAAWYLGALAGTAPRGATPEADALLGRQLLADPKEREEHQIVVDGILSVIASYGAQVELPAEPALARFKNVQHLHTPIRVLNPGHISPIAFLGRLHPTPAVGGQPRHLTAQVIQAQECFDRGWYAGPVGWLDAQGRGEFAVALRAGALGARRVRLFAGCGIVADSDPEREYAETQLKLQPMLGALALD